MTTLRGYQQPELSKKLYKIIKNENSVIGAYESAGRDRVSIASQLSDWGEASGDDALSDISDKLGVLLSEIGEQEDIFAQNLEDYRGVLKQIRNTESSVQPSRDQRNKITDEIQKLKYKDPANTKLVTLEQELVRAEAQNLVAEAQLSNVVSVFSFFFLFFFICQFTDVLRNIDTTQSQRSVRYPSRRRCRTRRKANHSRPACASIAEPA